MKRKQNPQIKSKEKVETHQSPLLGFFSLLYRVDQRIKEQNRGSNENKESRNYSSQTK